MVMTLDLSSGTPAMAAATWTELIPGIICTPPNISASLSTTSDSEKLASPVNGTTTVFSSAPALSSAATDCNTPSWLDIVTVWTVLPGPRRCRMVLSVYSYPTTMSHPLMISSAMAVRYLGDPGPTPTA